jgi:ABC-2 type transport system ATP-binding protein
MNDVVQVTNLSKTYGKFLAVKDISFNVNNGEIFGILGPNGAGKTTTLEILEGIVPYSIGEVEILGLNLKTNSKKIKTKLGIQLQSSAYFDYLTLSEILSLLGSIYPSSKSSTELLKDVNLTNKSNSRVKKLSGGEKHRFTLAAALVNDPKILILDEPTTALDPNSRNEVWDLIKRINDNGTTVIITTHYMEEANFLCDRIAIMNHGEIITVDTPDKLKQSLESKNSFTITTLNPLSQLQKQAMETIDPNYHKYFDNCYEIFIGDPSVTFNSAMQSLLSANIEITKIETNEPSLEDVFINFTKS